MAKYSLFATGGKVEFDNAGGTLVDMSAYVTEISTVDKEALEEDVTYIGAGTEQHAAVGISRAAEITLSGPYDDTATTGPDAIFNAVGNTTTRTLKITWGGTKTTSVETVIKSYKRVAKKGALTGYEVVLVPTGTVTET
jgi:hypothetical protein